MIAKLRQENFDLKQRERDYNILNSQLLDLEHRFRLLQEEKQRVERDSREREVFGQKKMDNLALDMKLLKETADSKVDRVKDLERELGVVKNLLDEKSGEAIKMREELADYADRNARLQKESRDLESDLVLAHDKKKAAENEADRMLAQKDRLLGDAVDTEKQLKETELEIARLSAKLDDANVRLDLAKKDLSQRENEVVYSREGRRAGQQDIDKLQISNSRISGDNKALELRERELELQLDSIQKKNADLAAAIEDKEKAIRNQRTGLYDAEGVNREIKEEAKKVQGENETLRILLDKYRNDAALYKKLKDEEAFRKLEVEQEKKRAERMHLERELEARQARRELKEVQESHEYLVDDKLQKEDELNAIKEHAELLESQNYRVKLF